MRLVPGALATAMVTLVIGCGGDSSQPPRLGAGPNVGAPINLADCRDWNQATTEERLGTLSQLKNFAGGQVLGGTTSMPEAGTGAVLDDKKAYDLLNSACKPTFAQGFQLYKLYQRAAAFAGEPAK
jgi:hypothetical protein